ncbi:hypothetical protein EDC18_101132 [Natranaerovirga pectinivora]|uniref:Uncharacterized protein n=1 Tax=Natranaerovirga pectinivora TaxID=682400 RepID=A0A4R3MU74_9FIRM|nr:hypothetical protein [Natranaerovirga pectinivora]TCT16836.1 hypothetical protein EDC18_101132 [Natranaerovirga pectinivora]
MELDLKRAKKHLGKGENVQESLSIIIKDQINAYNEYAMINFAFEYIVFTEKKNDYLTEDNFKTISNQIFSIVQKGIIERKIDNGTIDEIHALREDVASKLELLTVYADEVEMYEYIINRQENLDVKIVDSLEGFAKEVVSFIFSTKDNVIINQRLKDVLGQLPMRLTKTKFFDYIHNSLKIYKGSKTVKLTDTLDLLEKIYSPELAEGYGEHFNDILELLNEIKKNTKENPDDEGVTVINNYLKQIGGKLENTINGYIDLMQIINLIYSQLLCLEEDVQINKNAFNIIKEAHKYYMSEDNVDVYENVINDLQTLEGKQDQINYHIIKNESFVELGSGQYKDTICGTNLENIINKISKIALLNSSSFYSDLEEKTIDEEVLDDVKIYKMVEAFLKKLEIKIGEDDILVRRAKMSKVISHLPVSFSSAKEVYEYILFALNQCGNEKEKAATLKLIKLIMEDKD